MAQSTNRCPQCGVNVVTSKSEPEFRCPCCDATTVVLSGEATRKGERGDLVRRKDLDLSRFTIEKDGTSLFVSWKWSRGKAVLGLVITAVLVGISGSGVFSVSESWSRISQFDFSKLDFGNLITLLVALGPLVMVAGLVHVSLCCLVNRTEIAFGSDELLVWHGPIPSQKQTRIPVRDLERFDVHRKVTRRNDSDDISYELHAIRSDGRILRLIKREDTATLPKAVSILLTSHFHTVQPLTVPLPSVLTAIAEDSSDADLEQPKITLTCPRCAGTLDPPPERAELRCRHCGADVPIPIEVQAQLGLDPPRRHSKERLRSAFSLRKQGDTIFFAADWDRTVAGLLLKIVIMLLGIGLIGAALIWYFEGSLLAYALCLIPIAGGLVLGYIAVCYRFNRTEVLIDTNSLRIWHGPLPWRKPRPLPTTQITQFVVRQNSYWSTSDNTDVRWDLLALSHYGANQTLFSEIKDREALETVEYLIEERLRIVDQAVRG